MSTFMCRRKGKRPKCNNDVFYRVRCCFCHFIKSFKMNLSARQKINGTDSMNYSIFCLTAQQIIAFPPLDPLKLLQEFERLSDHVSFTCRQFFGCFEELQQQRWSSDWEDWPRDTSVSSRWVPVPHTRSFLLFCVEVCSKVLMHQIF